jgi:signal transduction histidine kinase
MRARNSGAMARLPTTPTPGRRVMAMLRRNPTATDAVVALLFSAAALVSLNATFEILRQDPTFHTPAKPAIVLSLLAVTLPLTLRRRFPLAVAVTVTVAFVVGRVMVSPAIPGLPGWEAIVTTWACWLALYSAAAYGARTRATTLVLAAVAAMLFGEVVRDLVFYQGGVARGLPLNEGFGLAYNAVVIILPMLLGAVVRSLRERGRELAVQATELQREREENARRAVLDERVRIARELHDVVAHHVSVMGIQAGAARRVMTRQPERAEEALTSIEASSRQAVDELHRLLGFLRREGQDDALTPQPDLAQLPELIAQTATGDFAVNLIVEGEPRPLPGTLELSAYRVIQEALTNTIKHSGATAATVRVAYTPLMLEIEVVDDGTSTDQPRSHVGGHGLVGMRERVRLHRGDLRIGPAPHGGFAVHAEFPLNGHTP